MFDVVLYQPEIPPNTGNVIRLCANAGANLHLIEPLGFPIDHAKMRRAGLDYHEFVSLRVHASLEAFVQQVRPARVLAFTSKGSQRHDRVHFASGDALLFGPETRGLPDDVVMSIPIEHRLRLPMRPGNRSLNLSNAVAIAVYEAWRQQDFHGALDTGDN
ncbi:MAG TPA: tRNA (uridine(34)/cytosine(34)/5-carboxymethylaminomethyluridine(34)-2'-O)-methyltransferase TrmL [Chiayiivirga sp.]|nr:tRNA (uridine(34)/cytosine(34)/5-carboxymethylaminomethyluridine(34)-2'-O)-methyltransferase TrmL [Chiayiivirga sp.]